MTCKPDPRLNSTAESTEESLANAYDTTPYAGQPFCFSHPSALCAYGRLYGMTSVPPERSRVLEMGCGDGANIIPMAHQFANSEFVGVDLSSVQIGMGQEQIDALKLNNIRLQVRNIMDIDPADGIFDYIIVHGVYSWVPDPVKEQILAVCRNQLAPQGVAYISYNVLPGWQFNKSMRDLMLFRTRGIEDARERTKAAYAIIKTLVVCTRESDRIHDVERRFFARSLEAFDDPSSYLLHEYLETDSDPFYFYQFASALERNGLQYICDAEQYEFELDSLPGDAAKQFETISQGGNDLEQYIDFLKNTRFRRSLVCHDGMDLNSDYRSERIADLFAATTVIPVLDTPEENREQATAFRTSEGRRFRTQHPFALAILRTLSDIRPCTMKLSRLIEAVQDQSPSNPHHDAKQANERIGHAIYSLFFSGVVELLGASRPCTLEIGKHPRASAIARRMAPSKRVTNLAHRTIVMDDELACFVLAHLDGTRDRSDLADFMLQEVRRCRRTGSDRYQDVVEKTAEAMSYRLESMLSNFARCGFLV